MASDTFTSPYTPNTDADREEMLRVIGVASVDDLFLDVPVEHRSPSLDLPEPRSEMELVRYTDGLAAMNKAPGSTPAFWARAHTAITSPPSSSRSPPAASS